MPFDVSPMVISLKTALTATVCTFIAGTAAAWLMSRYNGRLKGLIDSLLTLPLVLPPTVVGFFLLLLFGRNGPVGQLFLRYGKTLIFSWEATVISAAVVAFPLMYKTARGAFEQIDPHILGAARTLGSSEWSLFRRIMLPLAWPGVAAGTVLSFARALGEFGATLMIAGNIPGHTQTIPVAIYFAAEGGDMQLALLWVLIIAAISVAAIVLLNLWEQLLTRSLSGRGRL